MDSRGLTKWSPTDVSSQPPFPVHTHLASARLGPRNPVERIAYLLRKHLRTIAICNALALSLSCLYAMYQPRLYRSTGKTLGLIRRIDFNEQVGMMLMMTFRK
jgi:arginyl-tRNA--protein-N-Asp/Glu arginylyltransferase